jgi:hypothetical protein
MLIDFNINEHVLVQLTQRGRDLHRANWESLMEKFQTPSGNPRFAYRPPEEDSDGYSRWQMWHLMHTFGPNMGLASEVPFYTTIKIEVPD